MKKAEVQQEEQVRSDGDNLKDAVQSFLETIEELRLVYASISASHAKYKKENEEKEES